MKFRYFLFAIILLFFTIPLQAQYYGVSNTIDMSWNLGLEGGTSYLQSDVERELPGLRLGLIGEKIISRAIDIQFRAGWGRQTGQDLTPSSGFAFNEALNGTRDSLNFYDSTQVVYHNFSMESIDASVSLKLNLNRLFSSSGAENWDLYLLAGAGVLMNNTYVNAIDETEGTVYAYETITATDPNEVKTQLASLLDETYETLAHRDELNKSRFGKYILNTTFIVGGGARIKLSKHFSLGFQGIYQFVGDDLLDGQQWEENNEISLDRDKVVNLSLTAGVSF